MEEVRYCTPEWLQACAEAYRSSPRFEEAMKKLSMTVCYRVKAEPDWGIDEDLVFGAAVDKGVLLEIGFFSEADAKERADFILAASPKEWKRLLVKEGKFVADFMTGKISLEQGSKVGAIGLAPYADSFITALTQVPLVFQDEMTSEEVEAYRAYVSEFRAELAV
jgi:putative sterol carrier protein